MLSKTGRLNPPKAHKHPVDLNSKYWYDCAEKASAALLEALGEDAYDAWWDAALPDDASCYLICMLCRYKVQDIKAAKMDAIDRSQQMRPGVCV